MILVAVLSARVNRMSVGAAWAWFLFYAALNGVTLSLLLLVYTGLSVVTIFLATASLFGALAIIGHTTKIDLSGMGGLLIMGLIGLVIGLDFINLFIRLLRLFGRRRR